MKKDMFNNGKDSSLKMKHYEANKQRAKKANGKIFMAH